MVRKILTKTQKIILLTATGIFALLAASNAHTSEQSYILNGASQQTIINLVEQVGGEVLHDFDAISGVSAELTADQVEQLQKANPLLRFDSEKNNEVAGFIWDRRTTKGTRVA